MWTLFPFYFRNTKGYMKKRTKEEQSAYMKAYRSRNVTPAYISVTPSCNTRVTPVEKDVTPVTPVVNVTPIVTPSCLGCQILEQGIMRRDLEIKKLKADLALAKLELEKRVHTSVVADSDLEVDIGLPKLKPIGNNYKPNSLYGA